MPAKERTRRSKASATRSPSARADARAEERGNSRNAATSADSEGHLRMRDLTRITGLPRETIHFYLTQGLLPKPLKTGRNTAVYGEEHLERLQRIKDLQDRHFLPLKAIKAVLQDGAAEGFTEEQQSLLARLRSSIEPAPASAVRDVALSSIVPSRVTRSDLEAIRRLGVVTVHGKGAGATVTAHDAAVLECWAELTALTRPGEPKVIPELLVAYVEAMDSLVERETRQLTERFSGLPARRLLELIDGSEPPISRLMAVLRSRRIKQIIAGAPAAPVRKG